MLDKSESVILDDKVCVRVHYGALRCASFLPAHPHSRSSQQPRVTCSPADQQPVHANDNTGLVSSPASGFHAGFWIPSQGSHNISKALSHLYISCLLCMYVYTYVCIYIHVYIYIQSYIHTQQTGYIYNVYNIYNRHMYMLMYV
jgi:hypothetical protein